MAKAKSRRKAVEEKSLSKGQLRKLNALKKSLGDEIAQRAFAEWLASSSASTSADKDAGLIADTLWPLVQSKQLHIGRSGYYVKRGRGRLVVAAADA
jgi:hypothetical protein